jgi:hypothetical protein
MLTLQDYFDKKYEQWSDEDLLDEINEAYKLSLTDVNQELWLICVLYAGTALHELKKRLGAPAWRRRLGDVSTGERQLVRSLMQRAKDFLMQEAKDVCQDQGPQPRPVTGPRQPLAARLKEAGFLLH